MNSQEHRNFAIAQRRVKTEAALKSFQEYGFDVFTVSLPTAKAEMEDSARSLARQQPREAIEMMIAALQKAIA